MGKLPVHGENGKGGGSWFAASCDATGEPWQQTFFNEGDGRFASFVMEEPYLVAAARYVEMNPVRARMVDRAPQWRWSSERAHLSGRDDRLAKVAPLLAIVGDWRGLLGSGSAEGELNELRAHGRTGRPLGDEAFLGRLERLAGRVLTPRKPGRPRKEQKQ